MIEENNATTIEGLKDEIELLTASNGKLNHTVQDLETLNASFREENQRKTNEIQDLGANFDEKLRQSDKELSGKFDFFFFFIVRYEVEIHYYFLKLVNILKEYALLFRNIRFIPDEMWFYHNAFYPRIEYTP